MLLLNKIAFGESHGTEMNIQLFQRETKEKG